jgi:hypothetical protein
MNIFQLLGISLWLLTPKCLDTPTGNFVPCDKNNFFFHENFSYTNTLQFLALYTLQVRRHYLDAIFLLLCKEM